MESGNPSADRSGFRRTLGEFATGVAVITATVGGVSYGLTSNSFASVSLDPPLVLWSIRRESKSFAAFERCEHFAVNVLADDQIKLSHHFAQSGPDKFKAVPHTQGQGDAPLLHEVSAHFECRRVNAYEGGDHLILIGEVETFARFDRPPLLFSKGRYAVAAEHPDVLSLSAGPPALLLKDDSEVLSNLMIRAYSLIASELERGRSKIGLGLTVMQARLLRASAANSGSKLEDFLPELLLDFNSSQNILCSLVSLGLLAVDEQKRVRLTSVGETSIRQLIAHARRCEDMLLRNIPKEELAIATDVLSRIIHSKIQLETEPL